MSELNGTVDTSCLSGAWGWLGAVDSTDAQQRNKGSWEKSKIQKSDSVFSWRPFAFTWGHQKLKLTLFVSGVCTVCGNGGDLASQMPRSPGLLSPFSGGTAAGDLLLDFYHCWTLSSFFSPAIGRTGDQPLLWVSGFLFLHVDPWCTRIEGASAFSGKDKTLWL